MPCSGIARSVRKLAIWPRAWTPASVRDAPTTATSCASSLPSAASRWPCTVGPLAWRCQQHSAVPSYSTTSRMWRTGSCTRSPGKTHAAPSVRQLEAERDRVLGRHAGTVEQQRGVVAQDAGEPGQRRCDAEPQRAGGADAIAEVQPGAQAELEPPGQRGGRDGEQGAALGLGAADQPQRGLATEQDAPAGLHADVEGQEAARAVVDRESA